MKCQLLFSGKKKTRKKCFKNVIGLNFYPACEALKCQLLVFNMMMEKSLNVYVLSIHKMLEHCVKILLSLTLSDRRLPPAPQQ